MSNKEKNEKKAVATESKKKDDKVTKYFEQRIQQWLDEEMEKDALFRKRVESVRVEKTVKGACNYVLSVAKQSRQAGWDDDEVFGLVRHYFDEDDVKDPGDQNPSKVIISGHVDLSQEEKQEAMDKAKEEFKQELRQKAAAEEKARQEAEKKKAEERRKALMEKREKENAMMGDLFGGM